MKTEIAIVHHADRRTDVVMPYAPRHRGPSAQPGLSLGRHRSRGLSQAPASRGRVRPAGDDAGTSGPGRGLSDLIAATRYLTNVREQDDLNAVWAPYLSGHLPTTTTVEVSRLATHARCKVESATIAVTGAR